MQTFQEAKDTFFNCLPNQHYIFQITKCCGHFEWITILKNFTSQDLYRYLREYFNNPNILKISAKDEFGNILQLSESDNCTMKHLLLTNGNFFKPIYPLPHHVVYRLIIDDGHNCC
jgi:hypothetical protein